MVFSSVLFLFLFLPIFLLVYHFLKKEQKNLWVLLSSIVFYAWGEPSFIFIILGVLIIDFQLVKKLFEEQNSTSKKKYMLVSIGIKLGLLAYFKYSNFFIDNVNVLIESLGVDPIRWVKIVLPVGISFFTFQSVTYTLDVYWGKSKPLKSIVDYMLYILLFPQLIAGPIVRYDDIADQIEDREANETDENRLQGFYRFVLGLSKKVLIANTLGQAADEIFNSEIASLSTYTSWIGILCYTFQIYFDFSGYSDMAIGLGKMIGFNFPENFNNPYNSKSITEFWRRWHITLGQFMKDYLYIPLGGSKVATVNRLYFNLVIVFLLSGLWHGAGWNFIVWGAFHGLFLIIDRVFFLEFSKKIGVFPSVIITFLISMVGWVFFRTETLSAALSYLEVMFSFNSIESVYYVPAELTVTLILAFVFSFIKLTSLGDKLEYFVFKTEKYRFKQHVWMTSLSLLFLFLCVSFISSSGFNPFIYFRF